MTRLAAPDVSTEAQFQRRIKLLAYEAGWGISYAAARALDRDLAAYGQPPASLDGLVFHEAIAMRSEPGWPDLVLIRRRDRRLIFAELKMDRTASKLTPRQERVLGLLCGTFGVDWLDPDRRETWLYPAQRDDAVRIGVYVWRPSDLAEIERVLA